MKIALAQMEVIPGKVDYIVHKMLDMIAKAKADAMDLIVFPELCVSGYILSDQWTNDAFCDALMETPPAKAISHSPLSRLWQAKWTATNDVEQAVCTTTLGPSRFNL